LKRFYIECRLSNIFSSFSSFSSFFISSSVKALFQIAPFYFVLSGEISYIDKSKDQSMSFNQGCYLTSEGPLLPNQFIGFL